MTKMPKPYTYGKGINPGRLRQEILDDPGITTVFTTMRASSGVLTAVTIDFVAPRRHLERSERLKPETGSYRTPLHATRPTHWRPVAEIQTTEDHTAR